MVFLNLSHCRYVILQPMVVISNFSQAAQSCQLFQRKLLPAVLYCCFLLGNKGRFGIIDCLASLFLKERFWESDVQGRIPLRSDTRVHCLRAQSGVSRPLRGRTFMKKFRQPVIQKAFTSVRCLAYVLLLFFFWNQYTCIKPCIINIQIILLGDMFLFSMFLFLLRYELYLYH